MPGPAARSPGLAEAPTRRDAPPGGRSETVDAVRAVALVGVLLINMLTISGLRLLEPEALAALQGPADRALDAALRVFVEGKALAAFSLLFGFSFSLLLAGAERRGEPFGAFFARRLIVLAGLGLLNAAAFFWGDILVTYAAIGATLPLANRLPQRALLGLAFALITLPPLALAAAGLSPPGPAATADPASVAAFAEPSLTGTVVRNWALYTGAVSDASSPGMRLLRYATIGGLFLLGLHAGRSGLMRRVEQDGAARLRRLALAAVALGLALEAAVVLGLVAGPAATALAFARPLVAAGYVLLLAGALARPGAAALRRALAPLGRMALTGYLMGGLAGQAIFYGWGGGLIGRTGTLGVALATLGVVLAFAAFAHAWLRVFTQGPWEWLWRRLSRGSHPARGVS
jgi:uncharacterized protein